MNKDLSRNSMSLEMLNPTQGAGANNEDDGNNEADANDQGNDLGNGISGDLSTLFVAGNYEYLFEYQVNTYWYIAIGRYYSSEYSYACPYSVSVEVNSSCPTGAIGIPYGLSSYYYSQCSPQYTVVSTTYPATYSIVAAEDTYPMFKLSIPLDTGNIYFTVNATTTSLYIYGKSYGGPSSYTYNCYEGSYTTVGNYYVYDVVCYTPRAGDFFVVIDDQYDAYNATITFNAPVTCANGTGGWNCSFVSVPFSGSSFTATIPYSSTASYLSDAFYYFYVDIPANYSSNALTVSADTGAGSGIFFYRRNGYPEYSSYYGYESTYEYYSTPHTYTLNQFDWAAAGRIYFGVSCSTSPSCTLTASINGTLTSTSATSATSISSTSVSSATSVSGVSTTTTTTASTTTTSTSVSGVSTTTTTTTGATSSTSTGGHESSPASIVIPSAIFAAVAAVVALF